jgi:hypothetical protein
LISGGAFQPIYSMILMPSAESTIGAIFGTMLAFFCGVSIRNPLDSDNVGSTPAFVQAEEGQNATGGGQTIQISLSNPVTAGSLLVVGVRASSGRHMTVSSNPSNTWSESVYHVHGVSGGGWSVSIWTAPNAAAGHTTVTIDAGASDFLRAGVSEYSGVALSSPVEATADEDGLGTMANSGRVVTRGPNRLLFLAVATDSDFGDGQLYVPQAGYTLRWDATAAGSHEKIQTADKIAATAGTYDGRMQHSTPANPSGDSWSAVLVAFKPQ